MKDENEEVKFLKEEKAQIEATGSVDEIIEFDNKHLRERRLADKVIKEINEKYKKAVIWKGEKPI